MTKRGNTASPSEDGQHVRLTLADYLKIIAMLCAALLAAFKIASSIREDISSLTTKVDYQAAEIVYLRQRIDSLSSD